MRKVKTGGGWPAILYTWSKAKEAGGLWKFWKAMRSKNACKTCALGMGGQAGGMVNEAGHFPEVCKKSLQAMAADMQGAIREEFYKTYALVQLQAFSPRDLENCGRITTPVVAGRGDSYYQPITWEDALSRISNKLRATSPDETFWYFSGRSSNEAGFLLQLFARLYGTNNVNNCSYYCHQASGVGLTSVLGLGTGTVTLEDVDNADLVFVIGGNPASNHPRLMRTLMQTRRRGGEVIVINPVIETGMVNFSVPSDVRSLLFGSEIASLYVQPHIGGDMALVTAIAKKVLELGAIDQEYLTNHCEGWPELKAELERLTWDELCRKSGVSRQDIDRIADRYVKAKNVIFSWTMGITHHLHGVRSVQAIANLALMRGMIGRPGAGVMPIRGHSNVQGIGTVGVTPKLRDAIFARLQDHYGVKLPTTVGLDTMGCMQAAHEGKLKVGMCLGGNLYGSNPDATYAKAAIDKLDLCVYLSTTLNTGHAHGLAAETIILPVLARDEEPEPTTQESMFSFVRLSDGGPARHQGPRSEIAIVAELARSVLGAGGPVDWEAMSSAGRIREAISRIVPGLEQIAEIDKNKKEFHIPGRLVNSPQFPTASGRAKLHVSEIPELMEEPGKLRLMTIRSEGQFNTVVYEDYDLYRGQERRDLLLINPADLEKLGIKNDTRVIVRSECGEMSGVLARAFEKVKAGNVLMYYPEANVLVPRHLDPLSKTPAFKCVLVTVEPMPLVTPLKHGANGQTETSRPDRIGPSSRDQMRSC